MWVGRRSHTKRDRVNERLDGCSEKSASNNRVDSMDKETDFKKVDVRVRRRVPVSKEWTTYFSSNFQGLSAFRKMLRRNPLKYQGKIEGDMQQIFMPTVR